MRLYFKQKNLKLFNGNVLDRNNFELPFFDLGIISPLYNLKYEKYLKFCEIWLENCYFWAKDRAAIVIANLVKKE